MKIRNGTVQEAVDLARRMPDFSNPYNLNSPDAVLPKLDHVLVAEVNGIPVGFRGGSKHSPDTFAVWLAGVLPEYRRRGIGGALYRCQKDWLKSQGYRFLRTHVRNWNSTMLRILIDKGYHVVDVVRYDDSRRNKVVFVKNLWEHDAPASAASLILGLLRTDVQIEDQDLQARIRDFTISWLRFKYCGRIIEDSSVNGILNQATESGHKYCLVLTHGTIVSHAWELGLVRTIEDWANERDFFVAGKILQENGSHFGISPQGLLVKLDHYRKLANPDYGQPGTSPTEVAVPASAQLESKGNGSARNGKEYCLQPSGSRAIGRPGLPGWNLISTSLSASIPVRCLPETITTTLLDIAPQSDQQAESFKSVLGDEIVTKALDSISFSEGQFKFLSGVQRQVQNCRRGIFVWNFESYDDVNQPPANFKSPVSTLYSVAAGLKTSWILETHGFDEKTRLVYFDYSQQALQFKKLLHDEWNGQDYPEFLRYLFKKIPAGEAFYQLWGGFSPEDMEWDAVCKAWEREVSRWGGEGVIQENWRRTKELRVDYVLCNILEDQSPLLEQMDNRPGSVIWWSNVFFTFYSNWFHKIEARREIYEGFIRRLTARSPDVLIYGNDYNNIPIDAIEAAEYSQAYFQTEDNYLEPRKMRA